MQLNAMWKFTFFNYENTDENLKVFLSILKDMGIDCSTKDTLRSIVKDNDKMSKIYESYRDFIKKVKAKDRKNILNVNNTSLVLLHGPINHEGELVNYFHEPKRNLNNIISSQKYKKLLDDSNSAGITKGQLSMLKKRISTIKLTINYLKKRSFKNINRKLVRWPSYNKTILFGDLNATSNMDQIKNHFGRELSEVTTLLVPHHGSKKYWDQNFIKYFNNPLSVWVVNYGVTNTYGHPDPDLVDQLRDFDSTIKLAFNNEIIQIRQHWDVFWTKK
nr:hypothetical protein [Heyndrickxia oleronia]